MGLLQSKMNSGHLEDRNLASLELVEHSIRAQLEFEHLLVERDKSEIELAKCFPEGKLVLRGKLQGRFQTLDREVIRTNLIQDGKRKAVLYINQIRKICVAIDWHY